MKLRSVYDSLLSEGYKEQDELGKLATEIITAFAKNNIGFTKRCYKQFQADPNSITADDINYDSIFIEDHVSPSAYKYLGKMFDGTSLSVLLTDQLSHAGSYHGRYYRNGSRNTNNSIIKLKFPNKDFIDFLEYNFKIYSSNNKEPTNDDYFGVFRSAFGVAYRRTLIHELQHAYDDFRSSGKYRDNPKSEKYYSKYNPLNPSYSPEQFAEYYGLPHEYWARFSDTISDMRSIAAKSFAEVAKDFKLKVSGWENIDSDGQRRLMRALYKMWDEMRSQRKDFKYLNKK